MSFWNLAARRRRWNPFTRVALESLEDRHLLAGDWISSLPDSRLFSELSIPATHDTLSDCMKASCFPSVDASRAQLLSLQQQLDYGIRGLDIRVDHVDSDVAFGEPDGYGWFFGIVHGVTPMNYEFRDDVLQVVAGFLHNHPNEAILMAIQQQDAFTPVVNREFIETFEQYMGDTNPYTGRPYGELFWQSPGGQDYIPTLGEVRGKILLLQDDWKDRHTPRVGRWGLDYTQIKSGDPNDPSNARYYNALFQKVDSAQNLHPEDRWARSQQFFVETAIGGYLTPAGQPKFYENSLASTINTGIPGTLHHWDSPIEYATGKGCDIVSCRYIDGMNQRALSYLQSGQPRTTGIVYMDFPELGNTLDWDPDQTYVYGSALIDAIVAANFDGNHSPEFIGEITLFDDPNAPQDSNMSDVECQLVVESYTQTIDFRGNEGFNCDNDEAQSMTLRGVPAGTKLIVHDSPTFNVSADNAHITVLREIPGKYTIGSFEQNYTDDYIQMQYWGDGTLDGKVSAIQIGGNPTLPNAPFSAPFVVDYLEARRDLNSHYEASDLFNDGAPTDTGSVARLHTRQYETVNFDGAGGRWGGNVFGLNETFPDGDVRDRNNYFMQATADVVIPPGQWSIAFGSDDGGQLTLDDAFFHTKFNVDDPQNRSGFNQVWYNAQRGHGWTGGHFTVGGSGLATQLVASMFERQGGDSFEIAIRNNADFANSDQVSLANGWVLLRNGALGWALGDQPSVFELIEEGGTFVPNATNVARTGSAFARDVINGGGLASHQVHHLNDGVYGNGNSWIGDSLTSFAGISLGSTPVEINQLAFGRSNVFSGDPCPGGVCTDRSLGRYLIQYTDVPNPNAATHDSLWTSFGELNYTLGNPANPHLRHRYEFPSVMATGIRIIVPTGAAIDEIELYGPSSIVPLTNDNFADALTIVPDQLVRAATVGATSEFFEPAHAGVASATTSVWYQWTAPASGDVVISTQGSDFDTVLAVYSGAFLFGLTTVVANDDRQPGADTTSEVEFQAEAGATYRIAVAGYGGVTGNANLLLTFEPATERVPGDSSGDGIFNSGDLIVVFAAGEYEDAIPNNSTFEEGDWNGDGDFTTADLVFAFAAGTYQVAALPRAADPVVWIDSDDERFHDRQRRMRAIIDEAFAGEWAGGDLEM